MPLWLVVWWSDSRSKVPLWLLWWSDNRSKVPLWLLWWSDNRSKVPLWLLWWSDNRSKVPLWLLWWSDNCSKVPLWLLWWSDKRSKVPLWLLWWSDGRSKLYENKYLLYFQCFVPMQTFAHNLVVVAVLTRRAEVYRNWPRYGLRWSGLCCHSRHSTSGAGRRAATPAGPTSTPSNEISIWA